MYRTSTPTLVYRSTLHGVDAIDPSDGHSRWSWASGLPSAHSELPLRVLVDGDAVFFLGTLAHHGLVRALVALDALTGQQRWICNLSQLFPATQKQILMVACADLLVLTAGAPTPHSVGVARVDGRRRWARQEPFGALPVLSVEGFSDAVDRSLLE